ncbi:MAG: glycerophosphodiester phosphodiesterase [Gammaproteobacteria bacterium]
MKLPFIVQPPFRIIAHRGASAYAPENTMAAFQLAFDMGVTDIELDVQLTRDREVVICHDASLERYGHSGIVEHMNWNELSELDMGTWFSPFLFPGEKMIRLKDLFVQFGSRMNYHVEIKGKADELPDRVCRLVDRFGLKNRVIVTSFSFEILQRVRYLDREVRLGWLVPKMDGSVWAGSGRLALFQICPGADGLTERDVSLAHSVVPEVRAWGLRGEREDILAKIRNIIDAHCDGVTIDWPDWIACRLESAVG